MLVDTNIKLLVTKKVFTAKLGQGRDDAHMSSTSITIIGYFYNFSPFDLCLKYKNTSIKALLFSSACKEQMLAMFPGLADLWPFGISKYF